MTTTAVELIAAERVRQVEIGWTADKDDLQSDGELVECAVLIAGDVANYQLYDRPNTIFGHWPYERADHVRLKYGDDYVRRLTIAAALIAAEIDRIQRLEVKCPN